MPNLLDVGCGTNIVNRASNAMGLHHVESICLHQATCDGWAVNQTSATSQVPQCAKSQHVERQSYRSGSDGGDHRTVLMLEKRRRLPFACRLCN